MLNPSPSPLVGSKRWDADSHLDIHTIEAALSTLKEAMSGSLSFTIDLSRVDLIDTTGVQLLLALAQELRRRGVSIEGISCSTAVDQAFQTLGLRVIEAMGGPQ